MITPNPTYQVPATGAAPADPRFNVPYALATLYGLRPPVIYPGMFANLQREVPEVSFAGIQVVEDSEDRPTSHIGTPIFYPITLKGGTYRRFDPQGKVEEVTMQDLRLPITTVVEMARGKVITTTPTVASGGTVKEVYAMEDWSLRLSGILLDESNQPNGATTFEAMQERILEWFELADSIELEGALFSNRGIYRLVFKNISFNQIPGRPRFHGYQMEAMSDEPLELILE